MDYAIVSEITDPLLRFAANTALIAVVLTVVLLVSIVLLRVARTLRSAYARRFARDWRPLLAQCAVATPSTLPRLKRRDYRPFLDLWNHHYELLRGDTQQNLRQLALGLSILPVVQRMLRGLSIRNRLIAATTLGHLGTTAAVPQLERLTQHRSAPLSFAAARALIEIDPDAQLPKLLTLIGKREEWPLSRIALALRDLGADRFSAPIAQAAVEATRRPDAADESRRLLHLMELAHTGETMPAVERLLNQADEVGPDVIAACLRLLNDPRQAHWARRFATHEIWYVRAAAAAALRRIGGKDDNDQLLALLSDKYWWVRYRAAQAYAALPGITPKELEQVAATQSDAFAGDILRQVAAEERLR